MQPLHHRCSENLIRQLYYWCIYFYIYTHTFFKLCLTYFKFTYIIDLHTSKNIFKLLGVVLKFMLNYSYLYIYTCIYCRLGEVCSHIGALLFKVEIAVKMGLTQTSSTSKACQWNNSFRKEVH